MSDEMREESQNGANEQMMTPSCPNGQLYTIRSGDTMFAIARRANIPLQSLIDANPQIVDPNVIRPGQIICIPSSRPVISCPGGRIYTVVQGDTMYEIARRNNISLDALVRANPQIKDPSEIFPGQEICIPGVPQVTCPGGTLYTVKAGDTMYQIAQQNRISLATLVAANPQITNPDRIFPGQMICIPRATGGEMPAMPGPSAPGPAIPGPRLPVTPPVCPPSAPPANILPAPVTPPATTLPGPVTPPTATLPAINPPMYPCPVNFGQMPMSSMPVYIVVPWDECPYRCKRKRDRRDRRCR